MPTQETIVGFLGSGIVGLFVKHVIPSKKVDKFIPLINVAAVMGYLMSQGARPIDALVNGAIISLAAGKTHDELTASTPLKNVQVKMWWSKTKEAQGL